jgi:hypothetical protein
MIRTKNWYYRIASALGLGTALLLFLLNGAVGIIGPETQPANLLYVAVLVAGLGGTLLARLKARGMHKTFMFVSLVQFIIPFVSFLIWPQLSWGGAGMAGVLILNSFFAMLFVASALLFRKAGLTK